MAQENLFHGEHLPTFPAHCGITNYSSVCCASRRNPRPGVAAQL